MSQNAKASQWDVLLKDAFSIIDHVNRDHELLTSWTFGGGTAMMLQIDHRESHDVDLFVDDPQILPYLSASVTEMAFETGEANYQGDGTGHLKIAFSDVGEIDFIVAGHISESYAQSSEILGRTVQLETVAEIVAKKVRFRGASIQPRDIFDIAAASVTGHSDEISAVLEEISDYRDGAAARLDKLNTDYVQVTISQLVLKPGFEQIAKDAIKIARGILNP